MAVISVKASDPRLPCRWVLTISFYLLDIDGTSITRLPISMRNYSSIKHFFLDFPIRNRVSFSYHTNVRTYHVTKPRTGISAGHNMDPSSPST
jgi:hypothetical protein